MWWYDYGFVVENCYWIQYFRGLNFQEVSYRSIDHIYDLDMIVLLDDCHVSTKVTNPNSSVTNFDTIKSVVWNIAYCHFVDLFIHSRRTCKLNNYTIKLMQINCVPCLLDKAFFCWICDLSELAITCWYLKYYSCFELCEIKHQQIVLSFLCFDKPHLINWEWQLSTI